MAIETSVCPILLGGIPSFRKHRITLVRDKQNPGTERDDYTSTLQKYRLSSPVPTESLGVASSQCVWSPVLGEWRGGDATGKYFEAG